MLNPVLKIAGPFCVLSIVESSTLFTTAGIATGLVPRPPWSPPLIIEPSWLVVILKCPSPDQLFSVRSQCSERMRRAPALISLWNPAAYALQLIKLGATALL